MFRRDFLSKIGQLISIPFLCSFFTEKQDDVKKIITEMEKSGIVEHNDNGKYSRKYSIEEKTQYHQILLQLHDKQCISTKTLLEEIGRKSILEKQTKKQLK